MERKSVRVLTLIIVAALAACAGYVAGSRVGVRERTSLKSEMDRVSAAAELPESAVDQDERSTPALRPQMITDHDRSEAENRIAELECEVASLKEFASGKTAMPLEGPPAKSSPASTVLAKSVASPATKEQCSAITQKGVRCSRLTRSNGKCWQHGG